MSVVIEHVTGAIEPEAREPKAKGSGKEHAREPESERVQTILRRLERRRERLKAD
jgi:hypothetical protein